MLLNEGQDMNGQHRISLTDFAAQIACQNDTRVAAGLPPLDMQSAVGAAIREWNRLLDEARTRLQAAADHPLANNSFTHQVLAREIAPAFRAYLDGLGVSERRACCASPP
jgi:hypothetical protein